jgi:hypothetical protein
MIVVRAAVPDDQVIGLHAVPYRLERVLRLPFESQVAMRHRALWMATGSGPLLVYPLLRGE